ncbi:integrin beta-1-binding protein 1-like [Haliotis cracherodii]|uniref:integrin beta-1-binding protein 1-like n=1 Tax=Haliotis cracherodii TaxID=6455 RepID=UPI0039E90DE2
MFKSKQKRAVPSGSRESVESGNMSGSSNENLTASKEKDTVDMILKQKVHFNLFYMGMVQNVNLTSAKKRDTEAQLIDQVEEAQIEGKLPLSVTEEDKVAITVSRHGIKVMDTSRQEVFQRHPLHTIAQLIHYNDGFGKQNIALKIGQVGKIINQCYQCYIYQCHTEEEANAICQCVRRLFDAITAKA